MCQCPVFVNPANQGVLNALEAYADAYKTQGCKPNTSCDCAKPLGGYCEPDGNSGKCVTKI